MSDNPAPLATPTGQAAQPGEAAAQSGQAAQEPPGAGVGAPGGLTFLTDLDGLAAATSLTWRPLSAEDVSLWHALVEAMTEADDGQEHYTAEDLLDELAPWVDLERDTALGLDDDGVARAFGMVQVRPGDVTDLRTFCWGGVHPGWRGRGVGRALLAWQLGRAARIVARRRQELGSHVPGGAMVAVEEHLRPTADLAERAGLRPVRWMSVMRRDLSLPIPDVALPEGLRLVPFSAELDEPLRLAHNDAFTDHWGFQPHSRDTWELWSTGHRNFRPQWSFAVLDGDEIAAYALSAGYEQDWEAQGYTEGWTSKLGVRTPWRRRGLARALLAASLRAFRADGMQYGGLDVDSENPTGAVALYTGLGYEVVRRSAAWRLEL